MPLTNNVIIKLNEITTLIENKNKLKNTEIEEIKKIFIDLLKSDEYFETEELRSWFVNEGTWKNNLVITRIVNLAHYLQTKYEQNRKLKIFSEHNNSCNCK